MKEFWNTVQFVFTAVGGWLGYFLGGCDGLIYAWNLQKGPDLSACRNCKHPGCAGDRYGQCVTDSGGLLLSFQ